eukprot:CAMPEP_0117027214 /NCGR_PEP_ID=MMETSP0472-20121206/19915_1 /TAXON_ID=693140 ORGANISM="Tiarina fusus, Strain LIS" /NCGR_SAMPLE_ID=MMETSP0472 /ASSEMBLY_ACC=CAM_ASM_000603 /LENGTH=162 /DNA_ID=CAMNT_0004734401 /DNA_START=35 /DNA_END=523 /DNA_ORIENTATION=+
MSPHHDEIAVPDDFICPITQEIFTDPVMDSFGRTFQRNAILTWLSENGTCPMTREPRRAGNYIPNAMMVTKVRVWKKRNGIPCDLHENSTSSKREQEMVLTLKPTFLYNTFDDDDDDDTSQESSSDSDGEAQRNNNHDDPSATQRSSSSGRRRRFLIFGSRR